MNSDLSRILMTTSSEAGIEEVASALRARSQTVAFAESCTGGLVSARMAAVGGVSDVFLGSVVAYSNMVKTEILDVPLSTLRQLGAVSETVATAMANGVRKRLRSSWGVSITGIAGPGGGTALKPVGLVCFAVSGPGVEWSTTQNFVGNRSSVQDQSAHFAILMLRIAIDAGVDGLASQLKVD